MSWRCRKRSRKPLPRPRNRAIAAAPVDDLRLRLESDGERWDELFVRRLEGHEGISELFAFDIDVACGKNTPIPQGLRPGAPVTLVFESRGTELRRTSGILATVTSRLESRAEWHSLRLELVPRAHHLTLVETQSVYVDHSVSDVLRAKLGEYGYSESTEPSGPPGDLELRLARDLPIRELIVQFGESDLAFMSRLTEHLGISYFFEQEGERGKLVLSDVPERFRDCPGFERVPFNMSGSTRDVYAIEQTRKLVPKFYFVKDYNYRTPSVEPYGNFELASEDARGGRIEFGGHVKTPDEATELARVRAEEQESSQTVYLGKSTCVGFSAGQRTKLSDHPELPAADTDGLLLVSVRHHASLPTPWEQPSDLGYRNDFVAVPGTVAYRPPRRTPKPRMPSVITGLVQPGTQGEIGGVARIEDEGRYRIYFHFDPDSPFRPSSSHPIRMAQPFGGPGHGIHFPLRRGTEVLIAFVNGDPDRPIILGAAPNPTSPATVVAADAHLHRVRSPGGMVIEFGASIPTSSHREQEGAQ